MSQSAVLILLVVIGFCSLSHGIWPQPQSVIFNGNGVINVGRSGMNFAATGSRIVDAAGDRYKDLFFPFASSGGNVDQVRISYKITSFSEDLQLFTPEDYNITMPTYNGQYYEFVIASSTIFGALRALETLSQLVIYNDTSSSYTISNIPFSIVDYPRFPWRGLLIDSSRHFLPISSIKRIIDAMSYSKFNTLHWHLIDAQSFPIASTVYPQLTKTAYSPHSIYNSTSVQDLISYALFRGIRVVPEFDVPGHAYGWRAFPDIVTQCPSDLEQNINNIPLNVANPQMYTILENFLNEMIGLFTDKVLHVGGDEVVTSCWTRNPSVQNWMNQNGITNGLGIQQYFENRLLGKIFPSFQNPKRAMVWEDLFDAGVQFPDTTVIQEVWSHPQQLQPIIQAGYSAVLAAGYYLDKQIPNSSQTWYEWVDTWRNFYNNDPVPEELGLTKEQEGRVLGGEAAMWGENVDGMNIESRIFPRACGVAEKLWSSRGQTQSATAAVSRLVQFRCTSLARRGIGAGPVAVDYCFCG